MHWYRGVMLDTGCINIVVCESYAACRKAVDKYIEKLSTGKFTTVQMSLHFPESDTYVVFRHDHRSLLGYASDVLIIDECSIVPVKFRNVRRVNG